MSSIAATGPDTLRGLDEFTIEVPSWAYGDSGTRLKVFTTPCVPRDPYEKIVDAAKVHALTGLAPRVSLHIHCPARPGQVGLPAPPAVTIPTHPERRRTGSGPSPVSTKEISQ
jgi:hypothetical protein